MGAVFLGMSEGVTLGTGWDLCSTCETLAVQIGVQLCPVVVAPTLLPWVYSCDRKSASQGPQTPAVPTRLWVCRLSFLAPCLEISDAWLRCAPESIVSMWWYLWPVSFFVLTPLILTKWCTAGGQVMGWALHLLLRDTVLPHQQIPISVPFLTLCVPELYNYPKKGLLRPKCYKI